jgi:hypothetical protein
MGVVLEHAARQMPGNGFDDVLRLAGLEQVRNHCVPEIVKPKAREASGLPQRAPGAVPLARWLRWVVLMVLALRRGRIDGGGCRLRREGWSINAPRSRSILKPEVGSGCAAPREATS